MVIIERWNVKLIINQNKLKHLVSDEVSIQFNNYETDDPKLRYPSSIHGHFFLCHNMVKALLQCAKQTSCEITKEMKLDVIEQLRSLDLLSGDFVDHVSAMFLTKTFDLEEFQTIKPAN
jgi:hypothetical protein